MLESEQDKQKRVKSQIATHQNCKTKNKLLQSIKCTQTTINDILNTKTQQWTTDIILVGKWN